MGLMPPILIGERAPLSSPYVIGAWHPSSPLANMWKYDEICGNVCTFASSTFFASSTIASLHLSSCVYNISHFQCLRHGCFVLPRFTVAFVLVIALPDADRQEKDLGDEAWLVTLKKEFAIANVS